jgi:hypothetical protein
MEYRTYGLQLDIATGGAVGGYPTAGAISIWSMIAYNLFFTYQAIVQSTHKLQIWRLVLGACLIGSVILTLGLGHWDDGIKQRVAAELQPADKALFLTFWVPFTGFIYYAAWLLLLLRLVQFAIDRAAPKQRDA